MSYLTHSILDDADSPGHVARAHETEARLEAGLRRLRPVYREVMPAVKPKEAKAPKKAAENLDILCIKGLQNEPALEERFRTGLAELWAQAPEEHAVVCSCVRKHRDSYYGVFRMRSDHGHSYARVVGGSARDIGEKYLKQLETYKRRLPIRMTGTPFESGECNRKRCHLREKSIFHNGKTLVA